MSPYIAMAFRRNRVGDKKAFPYCNIFPFAFKLRMFLIIIQFAERADRTAGDHADLASA